MLVVRSVALFLLAAIGFRPATTDLLGAAICLIGVRVIMYTPR